MDVEVIFVWVGQGDCTLIRTNNNTVIMIDCGTSDDMSIYHKNVAPTLNAVMTAAGKTEIDYLILTHSDKDHCNLIPKVSVNYTFDTVYYGGAAFQYEEHGIDLEDDDIFKNVADMADHYYDLTSPFLDEADCTMWVVCGNYPYKKNPPLVPVGKDINKKTGKPKWQRSIYDNNGNSLVVVLNSNGYQMSFLGDATWIEQDFLYEALDNAGDLDTLNSRLIKMSHHGSGDSYNESLTEESLKPVGVMVSAGITFGHPDGDTIDGINTIINTMPAHQYMVYDEDDNEYKVKNDGECVYNTNITYGVSAVKVPKITKSGKKNKNRHAGQSYTELHGQNIFITIDGGDDAITRGADRVLLTTKSTKNVNSRGKKRKR
jgi:beta-lactamase superfamily II metal-dependent hydrolase